MTGYYSAIAALIAFGLLRRQSLGALDGHAVLLGLVGTTIAVATFLCLIVVARRLLPDRPRPRGNDASGWAHCCSSDRRSGVVSAIGAAARRESTPGCFNGRNAGLPEARPATLSSRSIGRKT